MCDFYSKFPVNTESYATNGIWENEKVLVPSGYPIARKQIMDAGYTVIEVDVSEFRNWMVA